MVPYHQLFYTELAFKKPPHEKDWEITFEQSIVVSAHAQGDDGQVHDIHQSAHTRTMTCEKGSYWCNNITLFAEPVISYTDYMFNVTLPHPFHDAFCDNGTEPVFDIMLSISYMNQQYTKFELGFKYTFATTTFLVMAYFLWSLHRVPARQRSFEQRWIAVLTIMLFFFDDPLFAVEVQSASPVPSVISVMFHSVFTASVLLFWLCLFDMVRLAATGQDEAVRGLRFYLPKVLLTVSLWFSMLSIYIWIRLQNRMDPAYASPDDFSHFGVFKVFTIVLITIYLLWLAYLVVRAMTELKAIMERSFQFKFILCITSLTILITAIGIAAGTYSPLPDVATKFITFYTLYNVYIWILAIAYSPSSEAMLKSNNHLKNNTEEEGEEDVIDLNVGGTDGVRVAGGSVGVDSIISIELVGTDGKA